MKTIMKKYTNIKVNHFRNRNHDYFIGVIYKKMRKWKSISFSQYRIIRIIISNEDIM